MRCVPQQGMTLVLFGGWGRSGQWRLAQKYLAGTASTPLDAGAAETLVLDCAKELFYSAASLQSAEVTQVRGSAVAESYSGVLLAQGAGPHNEPVTPKASNDRLAPF